MKTLKCKTCSCGEDVYENDYGNNPSDGFLYCINCGKPHDPDSLIEEEVPEIHEVGGNIEI